MRRSNIAVTAAAMAAAGLGGHTGAAVANSVARVYGDHARSLAHQPTSGKERALRAGRFIGYKPTPGSQAGVPQGQRERERRLRKIAAGKQSVHREPTSQAQESA